MAERSKTLDSKSSKGQPFGGSNPPLSVFVLNNSNNPILPKGRWGFLYPNAKYNRNKL